MEKIDKIRKTYIEYVLDNGQAPASFYAFAKKLKMPESELYEYYTSFEALEMELWESFFVQARATAEKDDVFQKYSVREKLLGLYYTWIEILKAKRSFVVYSYKKLKQPVANSNPQELKQFKTTFLNFANDLVYEGRESREIVARPYISNRYADALWVNTLFILDFWIKDTSKGFELTDTAIEKTVNTALDLMGRSLVDSVIDLAKFVYQNK